jgi:hypothetical protein
MNSRISSIIKLVQRKWAHNLKVGTITLKFLVEVKLIILKYPHVVEMIAMQVRVCCSPFNTGFTNYPSPSTISISFKESKFPSVVISCTESLLWFSIVIT